MLSIITCNSQKPQVLEWEWEWNRKSTRFWWFDEKIYLDQSTSITLVIKLLAGYKYANTASVNSSYDEIVEGDVVHA